MQKQKIRSIHPQSFSFAWLWGVRNAKYFSTAIEVKTNDVYSQISSNLFIYKHNLKFYMENGNFLEMN